MATEFRSGFLYTDEDPSSKLAAKWLDEEGIVFLECNIESAGEPIKAPSLISPLGQFNGLDGIDYYLDLINDPNFLEAVARRRS